MNDNWNEICYMLRSCIQENVLEKEYEKTIVNCMNFLHWRKFKGEITTQYPIQVGHETKYADIVITLEGIEQFVIEVKRPNHKIQEEDKKQLLSYMRMLAHPVKLGIYVGESIRLFYDDLVAEPIEICEIQIVETDPYGSKFVELFQKDHFSLQALEDFCEKQKQKITLEKKKQEEIQKLLADTDGVILKDLLREKYRMEGFPEEWINAILNKFTFSISSTDTPLTSQSSQKPTTQTKVLNIQHASTHDTTHYRILNGEYESKSLFVFTVVHQYVTAHRLTYLEYDKIFNSIGKQKIITTLEEAKEKRERTQEKAKKNGKETNDIPRWHFDKVLYSEDNVAFVVNNQWRKDNIQPIINFANAQGYNVEFRTKKQMLPIKGRHPIV